MSNTITMLSLSSSTPRTCPSGNPPSCWGSAAGSKLLKGSSMSRIRMGSISSALFRRRTGCSKERRRRRSTSERFRSLAHQGRSVMAWSLWNLWVRSWWIPWASCSGSSHTGKAHISCSWTPSRDANQKAPQLKTQNSSCSEDQKQSKTPVRLCSYCIAQWSRLILFWLGWRVRLCWLLDYRLFWSCFSAVNLSSFRSRSISCSFWEEVWSVPLGLLGSRPPTISQWGFEVEF